MCIKNSIKMIPSKLRAGFLFGLSLFFAVAAPCGAQTGKLNDTGATLCANETSNSVPCGYADDDPYGFPGQDGEYGRSAKDVAGALTPKVGASDAASEGFDFTKLAYTGGTALLSSAVQGTTTTTWGCTKDNVTGLIWDMKVTTASNARKSTNTYTWNDTNSTSNGGNAGTQGAVATQCFLPTVASPGPYYYCDTKQFIRYINSLNICGESTDNWRLPTRLELMSIVDLSKQGTGSAVVDPTFFPNIVPGNYWTADNLAGNPKEARLVNLASGSDGTASKSVKNYIILVRP